MTDLRKAAEMALEALEEINKLSVGENAICLPAEIDGAIEALGQALAQPEQEPVAWHEPDSFGNVTTYKKWALENGWKPLYTAPPKREWVGLTDEDFYGQSELQVMAMKYAEAKLKEKNA